MPARWSSSLFALLLLASAGWAERAAAPQPPRGIVPLTPESQKHLEELMHAAEEYRGLKAKKPVAAGTLDSRGLKERLTESSSGKGYSLKELRALEASLKGFGLIPEAMDLGRYLPELMSSQVAGYYDPNRKYLALISPSEEGAAKDGKAKAGDAEEEPEKRIEENMVFVHELTHALQDQYFDLDRLGDHDPMSDVGQAGSALIEGDATLTMLNYNFRMGLESLPGLGEILAERMQDPHKMIEETPDLPGAREMMAAPAWIRDTLLFSYLQGAAFCMDVKGQGGQKLLDYAFQTDPPRSTEQILHPEKWYGRRDDPVGVHLPELGQELAGYRKVAEGTLGELGMRILLRDSLQGDGEWAASAAAGWGGDRFAVYEKSGSPRLVVWVSEWDNGIEAGQFRNALQSTGAWQEASIGPVRVAAVRGGLSDERWARLRSRLKETVADRPVNKGVDLVGLGATAPEPDVRAAFGKFLGRVKMLEEIKKVLPKGAPAGEVSADGRSYTNDALGVSIRLPESLQGWRLEKDPSNPQILFMVSSPNGAVHVGVGYQILPSDTAPAMMSRMVERGVQSTMTEFHRIEEIEHNQTALKMRDVTFVAFAKGKQVMGALRTLARDSDFFFLNAVGPAETWPRYQATALRILNAFRVGARRAAS
jgi:hypothetical protein